MLVTLIYLAVQVQMTRASIKATAELDAARSYEAIIKDATDHRHWVMSSENVPIFEKGLCDFEELTRQEHMRFDVMMHGYFDLAEVLLFYRGPGVLVQEVSDFIDPFWRDRFFPYSGTQSWWKRARDTYSEPMQKWFEAELRKTPVSVSAWEPAAGAIGS